MVVVEEVSMVARIASAGSIARRGEAVASSWRVISGHEHGERA
jgi:hypothetical protein